MPFAFDGDSIMTAGELIAELQKYDPALPVWHEGCDCDGSARSVELDEASFVPGGKRIMITRNC